MKKLMVRTHPYTMHSSRLVNVLFALILSAMSIQATLAQSSPDLGMAWSFAVLGGASPVTCTSTTITGDVGVDSDSGEVAGCTVVGTIHVGGAVAQQAYADFLDAYAALELVTCEELTGSLAGLTLEPGSYCFDAVLTDGELTLDGPSNGIWIFKIEPALTATNFSVVMTGGEVCNNNVFWRTAVAATLTDSDFIGNILADTAITVTRGSLNGRALAKGVQTFTDTFVTLYDIPVPTVSGDSANDCFTATVTLTASYGYINYQWFLNGSPISGATTSSYSASDSGDYSVAVTDVYGCVGLSADHTVIIDMSVSVSEVSPSDAAFSVRLMKDASSPTGFSLYFQRVDVLDCYNVYEGTIGTWYSHQFAAGNSCNVAVTDLGTGEMHAAITPLAGDHYYVITTFWGGQEGPSGFASSGQEIDQAQSTCSP